MSIILDGTTGITTPGLTDSGTATVSTITSATATNLTIQSAGTTALTIDTSQNVGIGTASPLSKLNVENSYITVGSGTNTTGENILLNGYGYHIGSTLYGNVSIRSTYSNSSNSASLNFYTGITTTTTEAMRIDSAGNVGIGTTSPSTYGKFSVFQSGTNNTAIFVNTNASYATDISFTYSPSGVDASSLNISARSDGGVWQQSKFGYLMFATGTSGTATERMRIDSSGNVGIGTASPAGLLEISKSQNADTSLKITNTNAGTSARGNFTIGGQASNYQISVNDTYIQNYTAQNLVYQWWNAGTERMRIDSSGNVLVGTTTKSSSGGAGKVTSNIGSASDNCFGGTYSGASGAGVGIDLNYANTTGSGYQLYFRYNSTGVGNIISTSSATSYNTSSDYRLKENVSPMTGALTTIQALKPVTYKWKVDGSDGQGFIAHELQEIVPDCVSGEKDAIDAEGNPQYQGVDTSFLVATLTAAIQEQQTIIETLKTDIAELKAKVSIGS